jgi:hypothetical protein
MTSTNISCMHGNENKTQSNLSACRIKETKVKSACYALYMTALVAIELEVVTIVLLVHDPRVGCICTPTHLAIPLFAYIYICTHTHTYTHIYADILIHIHTYI